LFISYADEDTVGLACCHVSMPAFLSAWATTINLAACVCLPS